MLSAALLALCVVCGSAVDAGPDVTSEAGPVVRSASGVFRGAWLRSRRGRRFQAYRGIRYAEPPVGELRFQPPKPILTYPGEVDATQDGPACTQTAPVGYPVDEDCLTINVYTPCSNSSKPLPVIFFIHAGGFYSMSGRSDIAGPHYLLDRDIVLVTFNYRLASLGFLSLGNKLAPGNNGFKDQVAALHWVRRNVAAFGGDPHLVTIAGYSAGGDSLMAHLISPMSKGLFHRGIAMSGASVSKERSPRARPDLSAKQARVSHCPEHDAAALYDCLKAKPRQEVSGSLLGFYEFGFDPLSLWRPVVEPDFGQERFLVEEPLDSIREGRTHTVPLIVSQTTDEFFWKAYTIVNNKTLLDTMNAEWDRVAPIAFILPRNESSERLARLKQAYLGGKPIVDEETSVRGLGKLYGDSITGWPVHRLANLMCRHSKHLVYYYEFAYVGNHSHYENSTTKKPVYAAHHDDLIYLFSLTYRYPMIDVSDSNDSKMVDKMTALWYNFARYGDPNPRGDTPELSSLSWPAMTPQQRNYLRLSIDPSVKQNMFEDRYKLWDELYPF